MFEFFWVRTASVWIAALYLMMGLALLLFPAAGSTLFIWALAAGAGIYGAGHLIRWFQGRKAGRENPGDLFLTVLPAAPAATTPEPAKAPAEPDTTPKASAEPGGEKQESGT